MLSAIEAGTFDPDDFDSRVPAEAGESHDAVATDTVGPRGGGDSSVLDAATYEAVLATAGETAMADLEALDDDRPAGGSADAHEDGGDDTEAGR